MRALSLLVIVTVAATTPVCAQDDLSAILAREIIGPVLPMAEVQGYCEGRVVELPEVKDVAEWEAAAQRLREAVLNQIVFRGRAAAWRNAATRVEWLGSLDGGPGYRIKKLRFEALPGMWIPALLYEPEKLDGKVPAVLNVNGHTSLGKQYPPKQIRCINQAKRGMLALNVEWLGMGQLAGSGYSHARMNQLDLCGASGLAPFYLNMTRAVDVLLEHPNADPARLAVTGLSGGGWQTIVISALDTRVKFANPVAGYSSYRTRARHLKDLGDSEQTPCDLATLADYTHLTAMLAPRPALLTYNSKDDCCFESGYALQPLVDAARPFFQLYDRAAYLRTHVNDDPGTHNFEKDNRQALYRALGDFFFPPDAKFDWQEIPSDDEVKTADELAVELPANNEDFHSLALTLSRQSPEAVTLPRTEQDAIAWQRAGRQRLSEIVRAKTYTVSATEMQAATMPAVEASCWKLLMDGDWSVPAVELAPAATRQITIVVADGGRQSVAPQIAQWLDQEARVVAMDPFYFGESKLAEKDYLFALLVAAVGDRPVGIQASQVTATARWLASRYPDAPITVAAYGPRSSLFCLIAAALDQDAIDRVVLHDALGSLKEVVEKDLTVTQTPEYFCFGLLRELDIEQIAALVAPRPLQLVQPNDRARAELKGLAAWYRTLGREHDPLAE
ncbi:MAG: acetylxylan esterase [Planctomycetes bacterium]|nr:acetylxylan esterase [Planctomycetota bacterium]